MIGDDDTPGTDLVPTMEGGLPDYPGDAPLVLQGDYAVASNAITEMLDAIPDEQGELIAGFERLPSAARQVIVEFLNVNGTGKTPTASDADVADFAQTPAGRELMAEWRGRAARNLGKVQFRVDLMLDNMGAAEADKAERWYRALPGNQKAAVLRMLAG